MMVHIISIGRWRMKILEKYEIYDSETDEIYMTGYFDLMANSNLSKIREEHYFAKIRYIYKEV